ncbi:hypothetical protein GCM10027578_30650 [Spirosoma luteolum]
MELPLVQEKPRRTGFGKVIKWVFIGFNILMFIWVVFGLVNAPDEVAAAGNERQQEDEAVYAGIGLIALLLVWAVGAGLLGILLRLTRPRLS